jgi:hypothetical protein
VFVLKYSILHFFCIDRIGVHHDEARYKGQVVEYLLGSSPALAIHDPPILVTIWTFCMVFMLPNKIATQADTAVILNRLESRKSL